MNYATIFKNRYHAGIRLASSLGRQLLQMNVVRQPVVLGRPNGGVEVAAAVARRFDTGLDLVLVHELRAMTGEVVGAVAEWGVHVRDRRAQRSGLLRPGEFDELRHDASQALARQSELYRDYRVRTALSGRAVIIVDDVLEDAASMLAAIAAVRLHDPACVIAAVPILSVHAYREIELIADDVACVGVPVDERPALCFFSELETVQPTEVRARLMDLNKLTPPLQAAAPAGGRRDVPG